MLSIDQIGKSQELATWVDNRLNGMGPLPQPHSTPEQLLDAAVLTGLSAILPRAGDGLKHLKASSNGVVQITIEPHIVPRTS